jgi:hypothetical protein
MQPPVRPLLFRGDPNNVRAGLNGVFAYLLRI